MKFLRVKVERAFETDLYFSVPDDFKPNSLLLFDWERVLGRISRVQPSDWNAAGCENNINVLDIEEVSAAEAEKYAVLDLGGSNAVDAAGIGSIPVLSILRVDDQPRGR